MQRGSEVVRPPPPRLPGVISQHALAQADPLLAARLGSVLTGYLANKKGYESATRSYLDFCELRCLRPWPTDGVLLAAWLVRIATHVKWTSMKVYLAAVHYSQVLEGFEWRVPQYDYVRRALHWVRRRLPCDPKGRKFAITLSLLRVLFAKLPGWPNLAMMSHDDRLFASASWTAVTGFFRGGEFLAAPGSSRPILRLSAVRVESINSGLAQIISVPQPKATCWLPVVDVPCYGGSDPLFNTVVLWRAYRAGAPVLGLPPEATPAFHLRDGSALSKEWMVRRTLELCRLAGVALVDDMGRVLDVKMASWRAGGVQSAVKAKVPEPLIMELGRWKSLAWRSYLLLTALDVQGAARSMLAAAAGEADQQEAPVQRLVSSVQFGSLPADDVADSRAVASAQAEVAERRRSGRVRSSGYHYPMRGMS